MEILKPYRQRINDLDDQIVDLLVERVGIIREVGQLKFDNDIPAVLQDRVDEVRERAADRAAEKGIDADLVRQLYAILIDYSCNLEDEIKDELSQGGQKAASA
ncbi:MAG: chorismate mutase [Chloroflexi bacterium]|nr:chorismate mutase [Chloroflexota bacterium]